MMNMCYKVLRLFEIFYQFLLQMFAAIMALTDTTGSSSEGSARLVEENAVYSFKLNKFEQVHFEHSGFEPFPRSGHRIVCDASSLYSFGGYNPQLKFPLLRQLCRFNFSTREWSCLPNTQSLPVELASNAVIRLGDILLVYGGTGAPFGQSCSNNINICRLKSTDAAGKMSVLKTTGNLPLPQYGQAIVHHDNYIYTIGGTTGYIYTCDIHRLNLKTCIWEKVATQPGTDPEGRYRHEVAYDGKYIYMLGGGTDLTTFDFMKLTTFNLDKCEWDEVKTIADPKLVYDGDVQSGLPPARRCHGTVQIDSPLGIQVYICGGYDGNNVFKDLWRLDLRTLQWHFMYSCTLPRPIYFHSTAVTPQGKMYVFGGVCVRGTDTVDDDEDVDGLGINEAGLLYDTVRTSDVHAVWLRIPALSEMCWEALVHYRIRDRVSWGGSVVGRLAGLGVPQGFLERLK